MKAYLSVFSARFRTLLQYRAAAWAGIGTQVFFGFVRLMIFAGFFSSTSRAQPMSYEQVVSYIWLGQALLLLLPFRVDMEIRNMIRTGDICYELVRPVRLYLYWLARALAQRVAPVLLRAVPMFLLVTVILPLAGASQWGLRLPASAAALLLFFLSVLAALFLSSVLSLIGSISLFWTIAGEGVTNLLGVATWGLSGLVAPLLFFPDWAQQIFRLLPFRGLMDVPFRIYIGSIPVDNALTEIGIQVLWVIGLTGLGTSMLARGLRRVVVQGG